LQFRTASGGFGSRGALFHGHGAGADVAEKRIAEYFRLIDKGVREALAHQEQGPLLLAGVESMLALYREVNTYPNLVPEMISGNPDGISQSELHEKALAILAPYFDKPRQAAVARYQELAGTGLTATAIEQIAPAAYAGRVESLFVTVGIQQWGRFDPTSQAVALSDESESGNEDLLDFSAMHTLLNGGSVYAGTRDRVPGQDAVAAVLRY
jgi:Bacterial archaeo-eukaryotic release factor family 3